MSTDQSMLPVADKGLLRMSRCGAITAVLLASAAVAAPAMAQSVTNPGFETGDTSGWTVSGGKWYGPEYPPDPSTYAGPATLATIMTAGNTDPITGAPTVFAGNFALRLNDSDGGFDVTALQQTVNNYSGNKLYYAWNAVLEPSHGADDSPSFIIKVTNLTKNTVVQNIGYSAFTAQNSTIFRTAGQFVTTDWKVEDIDMTPGDDYQLLFLAIDCPYGAHAGYVYVDGFGNAIPTNNPDVPFNPATDVVKGSTILIPIGGTPDIDLAKPFYTTTELLANQVNPNFVGGTLRADVAGPIATAFTVRSQGGFIDTNGNDIEFSGPITGSAGGNLAKIGLGTLTYSGIATLDNEFSVDGGVLNLPGTISSLNVRVNDTGTLTGSGNVAANLFVNNGGRLAPGAGVGVLKVFGGNATMAAGSTLSLDIDGRTFAPAGGSGSHDRLVIEGGSFAAGGTIAPQLRGIAAPATNSFTPVVGDIFTVVTADSVTGEFDAVAQPTAGLAANTRFDVLYNPANVQLVLTPGSFRTLGLADGWKLNAVAAGTGLDAVRPRAGARSGNLITLFNNLYGLDEDGYARALQQLSGEIHPHAMQAVQGTARMTADFAMDAAQTYFGAPCDAAAGERKDGEADRKAKPCVEGKGRPAIWTRLFVHRTSMDDDAVATAYKREQYGFVAGIHAINTEHTRVGIGGRYSEGKLKTTIGSRADIDGFSVFAYGSHDIGRVNLSALIDYSQADVDTTRTTNLFTGPVQSHASYDITNLHLALEARTTVPLGRSGAVLRPVVGISHDHTRAEAVVENSSHPNYALSLPREKWSVTMSKLGAEAIVPLAPKLDGRLNGSWQYALDGDPTASRLARLGPASWVVESVGVKKSLFGFGAGLTARVAPKVQLRLDYNGLRDGGNYKVDRGSLGLAIAW